MSQKFIGRKPQTNDELKEMVDYYLIQEKMESSKRTYLNAMATPQVKECHHPMPTRNAQADTGMMKDEGDH